MIYKNNEELLLKISKLKKEKKVIVLCHGVFDILHTGHINHFAEAKSYGDILIVSVTADEYIKKGPKRPYYKLSERIRTIKNINLVDFVIPCYDQTALPNIKLIKPNFYVKGIDYKKSSDDVTKKINLEKKITNKYNGKLIFTNSSKHSASKILNDEFNYLTEEQKLFINKLKRSNYDLKNNFNKIKMLRVLVIGETIIDQYIHGEAIGKSAKDPIIVLNEKETINILGGAGAIAKNISSFSRKVTLASLFEKKSLNSFLKKELFNFVRIKKFYKSNFKTIIKKRIVESINKRKLLGLYNLNESLIDGKYERIFIDFLNKNKKNFDLVIVADYGHGFISDRIASCISKNFKKSFINSQINSFNIRSQNIFKYNNSFCIVINETELRMDLRENYLDLNSLSKIFFKKYNFSLLVITSGSQGVRIFEKGKKLIYCPAFDSKVIDKTGAGDSFLALFSICQSIGFGNEYSAFIASLAAAESLKNLANSKKIEFDTIVKSAQSLLS